MSNTTPKSSKGSKSTSANRRTPGSSTKKGGGTGEGFSSLGARSARASPGHSTESLAAPEPPLKFLATPAPPASANTRPRHLRVLVNTGDAVLRRWRAGQEVWVAGVGHGVERGEGTQQGLGIIWPLATVPAQSVQLGPVVRQNGGIELGAYVTLREFEEPVLEAARVTLRPVTPPTFAIDEMFSIYAKEILVDLRHVVKGATIELQCAGKLRLFLVEDATPVSEAPAGQPNKGGQLAYRMSRRTEVSVSPSAISNPSAASNPRAPTISYASVGGLGNEIATVREMVETSLNEPEKFTRFGLRPPRGVLLFGPPGTGKTLIARAVAAETGAHVINVNGPEVISKYFGETEEKLRKLFTTANENAPSIIFIDEIDALCPKRDSSATDLEKRVVATLLTLMDGADATDDPLDTRHRVVIMGATNRPNSLDEALRRPGRFDREIEIGIPSAPARLEILTALLRHVPHSLSEVEVAEVAAKTHGYVGADLAAVCREAGLKTIKRVTANGTAMKGDNDVDLRISHDDVLAALTEIKPSAMREIMLEVPKVLWTDIGGQAETKQKLKEAVEWPLKHPEAFARFNIRPPKGILLYGPPGCSKTLMAKALATEAGLNFIAVKGPELFSKWVGESEKAVREVFRKARAASPSIVFFDEIDALAVRRGGDETSVADRVLSQLLAEMDGIEPLVNVTVVAATNRPDIIDSALLRPGRIDRILYVSPPDQDSRREIFRIQTKRMACSADVDVDLLSRITNGYSGAECVAIGQEAAMRAMEENLYAEEVCLRHFEHAVRNVTPRITDDMIKFYDDFRMQSGLRSV